MSKTQIFIKFFRHKTKAKWIDLSDKKCNRNEGMVKILFNSNIVSQTQSYWSTFINKGTPFKVIISNLVYSENVKPTLNKNQRAHKRNAQWCPSPILNYLPLFIKAINQTKIGCQRKKFVRDAQVKNIGGHR